MAFKVQKTNYENTFDLRLEHADIVDMMNDPQVLIASGNVSSTQPFQILILKPNGSEVIFSREMVSTDTLIIRFKNIATFETTGELGDIDMLPNT
jgi:hypothetical protein